MPPKARAPAPKKPAAPRAAPTKKAAAKAAAPKPKPVKKQTSDRMASIGARAMRGETMTPEEIRAMGASLVGQDETAGKRKP